MYLYVCVYTYIYIYKAFACPSLREPFAVGTFARGGFAWGARRGPTRYISMIYIYIYIIYYIYIYNDDLSLSIYI